MLPVRLPAAALLSLMPPLCRCAVPPAGQEFPRGLQNEVLCVLKGKTRSCKMRLVRPRAMSFMVLSRAVWTEVGGWVEGLQRLLPSRRVSCGASC